MAPFAKRTCRTSSIFQRCSLKGGVTEPQQPQPPLRLRTKIRRNWLGGNHHHISSNAGAVSHRGSKATVGG